MNKQSWLLNLSLLKTHPAFRAVFLARFISIVSLGLLGVAVPVQIQMMTHSTWQVGLSVTLTGGAMFVGLMVGGVLADRYERKKVILLARGTCGIGFIGLCLNALLPEPSMQIWKKQQKLFVTHWAVPERAAAGAISIGNLFTWFMGWFFRITWRYGATGGDTCTGRA